MMRFIIKHWEKILVGAMYLVLAIQVFRWACDRPGVSQFSLILIVLSIIFACILTLSNNND
jgi:hypothetical protein